ncbi:hypothetical protein Gpo141_00006609 [Globisporangium polare]
MNVLSADTVMFHDSDWKSAGSSSNTSRALTNEQLEELLKEDVLIRNGVESGGIIDGELLHVVDRDLVVKSFVLPAPISV